VTVWVYNGLNKGISNVSLDMVSKGKVIHGVTDEGGKVSVGVSPGNYRVIANVSSHILIFQFTTDFPNINYPIIPYAKMENNGTIRIHVDHYLNGNLSGVEIHIGKSPQIAGYTNDDGDFYLHVENDRFYDITVIKRTYHISPPVGSVVVYVDGEYALANRWPPRYSYLLIPFWLLGIEN